MLERVRRFTIFVSKRGGAMSDGLCNLQYAVGRTESCPGEPCPFWEKGVGCVVGPIESHLIDQPSLAQHLLALRANLDRPRQHGEREESRRLFYRLLNQEQAAEGTERRAA
jgi:hypothetical protein